VVPNVLDGFFSRESGEAHRDLVRVVDHQIDILKRVIESDTPAAIKRSQQSELWGQGFGPLTRSAAGMVNLSCLTGPLYGGLRDKTDLCAAPVVRAFGRRLEAENCGGRTPSVSSAAGPKPISAKITIA
jgi:hypothetical protein